MRRIAVTPVKCDNLLDEKKIYKRIAKVARPYPTPHPTTTPTNLLPTHKRGFKVREQPESRKTTLSQISRSGQRIVVINKFKSNSPISLLIVKNFLLPDKMGCFKRRMTLSCQAIPMNNNERMIPGSGKLYYFIFWAGNLRHRQRHHKRCPHAQTQCQFII